MRITISGTPGSGKSTVAKLLAKELACPYLNAGQIFREAAEKRRMSLAKFAAYVEAHPALDERLDAALMARARQRPDVVLEGRLMGWMTKRAEIPALRLWITARESARVDRLLAREGGTRAETIRKLKERARGEVRRYRKEYGVDLADLSPYDMVIHTDDRTPEEVVAIIRHALHTPTVQAGRSVP